MVKEESILDIIIPVYNAKKTLLRTLCSIALQKKFYNYKVYIINDCDNWDYNYEIDFVKNFFKVNYIKLEKNVGPGQARQKGINASKSKYIMFIDSDDYLYNPYVLYEISNIMKKEKFDLLVSNFIYQRDNEVSIRKNDNTWLHGKVYNRKFLEDNQIEFNDTRANEDNGFNRLIFLNKPIKYNLDLVTYVYAENSESITRRNNREYKFTSIGDLVFNINWAMSKVIDKEKSVRLVALTSYALMYALYYYYNELYDEYDVTKIIEWSKDSLKYYNKYSALLTEKDKQILIEDKKTEYINKSIDFKLSFNDFLKKVSEYND